MRVFLAFLVIIVAAAVLVILKFFTPFSSQKAALKVISQPQASVFLDEVEVGTTPFEKKDLEEPAVLVRVGTGSASWASQVKLTPGTFTVVNRELSDNSFLAAGEVLNLEKGRGLQVLSIPDEGEVTIDGKLEGQTPVNISNLSVGEHLVLVSQAGYIGRSVQVQTHQGYRVVLAVSLSLETEEFAKLVAPLSAVPSARLLPKVTILPTPTGWLRVRDQPSLAGAEIAKVNSADVFPLLGEETGWFKIGLKDNRQGWISSQFAQKL